MASDEMDRNDGDFSRRKRRRRRRTRRPGEGGAELDRPVGPPPGPPPRRAPPPRAQAPEPPPGPPARADEPRVGVSLPRSGRVPRRRLAVHPSRGGAISAPARRRKATKTELDALADYLNRLSDQLVGQLYSGLGGQPGRVPSKDRMIQLTVRAIGQGNRLGALVRSLHQRDRQALAILLQCGGLAHHDEFRQELTLSLGGNEREWKKVMSTLGDRGLVSATDEKDGEYFYLIPEPLIEHLLEPLREDLVLPSFDHEDVRVSDARPFCPPLDFSLVSLATYMDQHPPRLTQRHEIFKVHKDDLDHFFAQLWAPDSELFSFHVEFLMMHGMVELKGDRLAVNRAVLEEWLQLDEEDQNDLIFSSLDKRFPQAEWVFWAVHDLEGAWVPERPLQALYRRWRRGEEWRERYHNDQWATPRTATREGYSFTPLVNAGMLEMGQWGQEKFYRLSNRARHLLERDEEASFQDFYLTPSFEIMAPAGMSAITLFRIGELAELTACDRANTYKITEPTIEAALDKGWRRDDVFEFLRDNSQIGLPDNVEQTLRGWMGHHGDVEYHDVMLLTVHRTQIRRLESSRRLKPYLLHRFVPGMYAVDRSRVDELNAVLRELGFSPAQRTRQYPNDPGQTDARGKLMTLVVDARTAREDLIRRTHDADSRPEQLCSVPGSGHAPKPKKRVKDELPPRRSPREVRELAERAIALGQHLEMLYVTRDQQRKLVRVAPEKLAVNQLGAQVLVARNLDTAERLSYQVVQIERLAVFKPSAP
jgi:signal recognition particle subunit SEC65